MINYILLIISPIVIYEFIQIVKFINILKSNLKIYSKILKLLKYKKVSDFRKEKLILNYSKSLLLVSLKIIAIIFFIFAFIMILNLLSNTYLDLIISLSGIIGLSIIFLIYHLLRTKFYEKL